MNWLSRTELLLGEERLGLSGRQKGRQVSEKNRERAEPRVAVPPFPFEVGGDNKLSLFPSAR